MKTKKKGGQRKSKRIRSPEETIADVVYYSSVPNDERNTTSGQSPYDERLINNSTYEEIPNDPAYEEIPLNQPTYSEIGNNSSTFDNIKV